jgi:drug/metabolite transporter (DMT)-like permease
MAVPLAFLLPLVIKRGSWRVSGDHRLSLLLGSSINALRMLLYILSFKLTAMGNAVVLLYLWPLFALLLQSLKDRRLPKPREFLLVAAAFTGVTVMNLHRDFSLTGNDAAGTALMTASALLFAWTTLIFKKNLSGVGETDTVFFQNVLGALIFFPFLMTELPSLSGSQIFLGILYGFLVGLTAFTLFFYALKRLPLFQYSAMAYIEVLFGLVFSVVFLFETITWNMIAGAMLVVGASFMASVPVRTRKSIAPEEI